jgi:hypothetical protein
MEVEADGYVPHMLLSNLFQGGVGDVLIEKLAPSISKDDLILTLLSISACAMFYLWGPRTFELSTVESYEHPPVLHRLNVMLTDQGGWCEKNAPNLVHWATPAKFQEIMELLVEVSPHLRCAWDVQSEFLLSSVGRDYVARLYSRRETLRSEMAPYRWEI